LKSELEAVLKEASAVFPGCKTENCTWDDVFEQIDAVKEAYDAKAPKGSFRNSIRGGKADAKTLKSLISIIPDEKGLSILRVGLSFIFQVPLLHTCVDFFCQLIVYLGLGTAHRKSRENNRAPRRHC
jgi:hypothetical protein